MIKFNYFWLINIPARRRVLINMKLYSDQMHYISSCYLIHIYLYSNISANFFHMFLSARCKVRYAISGAGPSPGVPRDFAAENSHYLSDPHQLKRVPLESLINSSL